MKRVYNCLFLCYYFIILINASRKKGELEELTKKNAWSGKWFPGNPFEKTLHLKNSSSIHAKHCDDGVQDIEVDFSLSNQQQNYNYLCISNNKTAFLPNVHRQTVQTNYYIPAAYELHSVCNKEPLSYEQRIPTFGAFRLLAPKFGEYIYLPPQRWLRSLAEGAIVMLYHPCADRTQLEQLKKLVNACLYRHIITPSSHLSSEYPLALLAWGKSLKLSVVDRHLIVGFIRNNAKKGPFSSSLVNELQTTQYYEQYLLKEARLVTNLQDTKLC